MKRSTAPTPTTETILSYDNVPAEVASRYIGWSTPTIYRALQEVRAPFGFAVQNEETGTWAYNISPGLSVKDKQGDWPTYRLKEVEEPACEGIERILSQRLNGVNKLLDLAVGV